MGSARWGVWTERPGQLQEQASRPLRAMRSSIAVSPAGGWMCGAGGLWMVSVFEAALWAGRGVDYMTAFR